MKKLTPEDETNAWFNKLTPKQRQDLKGRHDHRTGERNRQNLNRTPEQWWGSNNWAQKSDIHYAYKHHYISKSKGKAKTPKPSKTEEVN